MIFLTKNNFYNTNQVKIIRDIYESSFPIDERRDFNLIQEILNDKRFIFNVIKKNNKIIGILSSWKFDKFTYIEHFAICKEHRNKGLGTETLNIILSTTKNLIVIEVEKPDNEEATKRINFYKKFSFIECFEDYIQPPYDISKQAVPMLIMSKPSIKNKKEFNYIKNTLYKYVYKYSI